MALGGNRNTAYCHALFTYNQRVKSKVTDVATKTEKHFRTRIIKVGVNHFLLYHSHVLAIVQKSWTSLCELIHFISRVHLLHWVDTYGCGGWRRRLSWQNETAALAEGVECSGWRRRMQWPEETNAVAGGDTFWTLITRDCGIILKLSVLLN